MDDNISGLKCGLKCVWDPTCCWAPWPQLSFQPWEPVALLSLTSAEKRSSPQRPGCNPSTPCSCCHAFGWSGVNPVLLPHCGPSAVGPKPMVSWRQDTDFNSWRCQTLSVITLSVLSLHQIFQLHVGISDVYLCLHVVPPSQWTCILFINTGVGS